VNVNVDRYDIPWHKSFLLKFCALLQVSNFIALPVI
jgi:hypothetical protein